MKSKLKTIKNKIAETDFISEGYKIPFNNKESNHYSFIGGITSIFISCIMIVYIVNQFLLMNNYKLNSNSSTK